MIYVYEAETLKFIGVFSTVECAKQFKIGKDTLTKYLSNKLPLRGKNKLTGLKALLGIKMTY